MFALGCSRRRVLSLRPGALADGLGPGVFPYLGGSVRADRLQSVVAACGGAVVSGKQGAKLAATTPGVLVDPAAYFPSARPDSEGLFDYDDWLIRQQAAGVPVILTDTPRIPDKDRSALQKALARWRNVDEPTVVVLPIEPWWLRDGLAWLTEEVREAGRPVVLLRCDISAIGAVAHGAFAGFVGWSASSRHGPLPVRQPGRADDDDRDESPSVFMPALNDYFKASKLPAFRNRQLDVLHCDDPFCGGESLLAGRHNLASTEQLARRVLTAAEPRDAWWETCRAGSNARAFLAESGISLPASRWLRQWLDLGSPSHNFRPVG